MTKMGVGGKLTCQRCITENEGTGPSPSGGCLWAGCLLVHCVWESADRTLTLAELQLGRMESAGL